MNLIPISTTTKTLTIDWQLGKWRIVHNGAMVGVFDEIQINTPAILVNATMGHGVLQTTGRVIRSGDKAIIEG